MKFATTFILILTCMVQSAIAQTFSVKETSFKSDSLILFADIYTPKETKRKVGIALIQGSGNSDRANGWARSYAEILATNGYYVLFPDKRGSGKSGGSWKNASFHDLAADAIASLHHLQQTEKLDLVGVMGLSQGGFIAPIVASEDSMVKFVIDIVGAAVTLEEQIIHEVMNTAKKEGLQPNEIKEVLDLHVLMKQYAIDRNWTPLEKRFAELDTSSWSKFAKTFPNKPNMWVWDWVKLNLAFDPIKYWTQVKQDVFVAYGSKDQEDNMPVYESVYRLQKGFQSTGKNNYVINVYDTGHAMYENDKAELRKEFIADLLSWLKSKGN